MFSKKQNKSGVLVYCRKHIHLLAGTHVFVMDNTEIEGVIEWPSVSDPVKALLTIETLLAEPRLKGKARGQEPQFVPSGVIHVLKK